MILEIIIAAFIGPIIYFIIEYIDHLLHLKNYPKGPFPLPIVGNLHLLSPRPYLDFIKLAEKYGNVYSVSLGMKRTVIVNSVKEAREMLVTKSSQFAGRPTDMYTNKLLSRGFRNLGFSDYGPYWKLLRKLVHSSLKVYGENMEKFDKLIVLESEYLHDVLKEGKSLDPEYTVGAAVLNIICQVTFGHRYDRNDDEFKKIIKFQRLIFEGLGASDAVAFLPWLRIFPLKGITSLKKGLAIRDPILQKTVQKHKEQFDPNNVKDFTDDLIKISQDQNYLNKSGVKEFGRVDLEMAVNDMFIGGTETTLTVLRWFFAYMLHWPEWQDKLYNEIIEVVGYDRYPKFSDRDKLHLFNAVIHETLRMSSIAPLGVPRKTTENTSLKGKNIPKNTQVIINVWNLHHSDKYWENPKAFNPNRWLDDEGNMMEPGNKQSYLPFSAGIRGCPGEALAKLELFLFASRFIRDFQIELPKDHNLPSLEGKLGITLSPKPFKMVCVLRNNNKTWGENNNIRST